MDKRSVAFKEEYIVTPEDTIIMSSVFLFIFIVILIAAVILVIKIYKSLRFQDIPMLMSAFTLSLCLIF